MNSLKILLNYASTDHSICATHKELNFIICAPQARMDGGEDRGGNHGDGGDSNGGDGDNNYNVQQS